MQCTYFVLTVSSSCLLIRKHQMEMEKLYFSVVQASTQSSYLKGKLSIDGVLKLLSNVKCLKI